MLADAVKLPRESESESVFSCYPLIRKHKAAISPAAVASAVAGAVSVILSPLAIAFALEIVNVPVVPLAANTTVPKLVPPSANVNVVEAVAAVLRLQ